MYSSVILTMVYKIIFGLSHNYLSTALNSSSHSPHPLGLSNSGNFLSIKVIVLISISKPGHLLSSQKTWYLQMLTLAHLTTQTTTQGKVSSLVIFSSSSMCTVKGYPMTCSHSLIDLSQVNFLLITYLFLC
jgi:hypothetical protein